MKAIRMQIQKSSRWLVILLASVVVIITTIVVANATQTITTPNAVFVSYSLANGTSSAAITPVTNRSVLVMGCCTTHDETAVSHVGLLHLPGAGFAWTGLEGNAMIIATGASSTAGTNIVSIDALHVVDIQVASADTILIHNGDIVTVAGNVTLIW